MKVIHRVNGSMHRLELEPDEGEVTLTSWVPRTEMTIGICQGRMFLALHGYSPGEVGVNNFIVPEVIEVFGTTAFERKEGW